MGIYLLVELGCFVYVQMNDIVLASEGTNTFFDGTNRPFFRKKQNNVTYENEKPKESRDYIARINSEGLRDTPVVKGIPHKHHAIFLGCSYVFGQNNEDHETIPFYFNRRNPEYKPYNFGYPGLGPSHLLRRLELKPFRETVSQESGIGILILGSMHFRRVAMEFEYLKDIGFNLPYYYLNKKGELAGGKSLLEEAPLRVTFYKMLKFSFIRRLLTFHKIYPKTPSPRQLMPSQHLDLFEKVIGTIRSRYESAFPKGRFYVYFIDDFPSAKAVSQTLVEKRFRVIPLIPPPGDLPRNVGKYRWRDGHWKPHYNKLLADYLSYRALNFKSAAK